MTRRLTNEEISRSTATAMRMELKVVDAEVVGKPSEVVVPYTGEVLDLAALPVEGLAATFDQVRDLGYQLRTLQTRVSEEIHTRMDAKAEWTARVDGWKVTGTSPEAHTEYDKDALVDRLNALVGAGKLTEEQATTALVAKTEYVVSKSAVNKLLKLGGLVKELIESCKQPKETPRRVTVVKEVR